MLRPWIAIRPTGSTRTRLYVQVKASAKECGLGKCIASIFFHFLHVFIQHFIQHFTSNPSDFRTFRPSWRPAAPGIAALFPMVSGSVTCAVKPPRSRLHCPTATCRLNRIHSQIPVLMLKNTNFCCLTVNIPHTSIEIGGYVSSRVVGMGRSLIRVVRARLRNAFDMESLHCLRSVQRRACSAWRPVRKRSPYIPRSQF